MKNRARELATLDRDVAKLAENRAAVSAHQLRRSHRGACRRPATRRSGATISAATKKRIISKQFDKPVIIHRYPAAMKAFYMATDPARPDLALSFDMIAPEGYGEIIGGGERQSSYETLLAPHPRKQSARGILSVVSRPAPLRQRPARRLRPGPGTHRRLDLRNRAHPRSHPLPTHALSRLSLKRPSAWGPEA